MDVRAGAIPGDGRAAGSSGLEDLALVVATYGPERLLGPGAARVSDHALRDAIRCLVAEAREGGTTGAEGLVIDLRRAWSLLPVIRQLSPETPRQELWDRVVTLCCEEFYATRDAGATSRSERGSAP
jgi:hypothetical protein